MLKGRWLYTHPLPKSLSAHWATQGFPWGTLSSPRLLPSFLNYGNKSWVADAGSHLAFQGHYVAALCTLTLLAFPTLFLSLCGLLLKLPLSHGLGMIFFYSLFFPSSFILVVMEPDTVASAWSTTPLWFNRHQTRTVHLATMLQCPLQSRLPSCVPCGAPYVSN